MPPEKDSRGHRRLQSPSPEHKHIWPSIDGQGQLWSTEWASVPSVILHQAQSSQAKCTNFKLTSPPLPTSFQQHVCSRPRRPVTSGPCCALLRGDKLGFISPHSSQKPGSPSDSFPGVHFCVRTPFCCTASHFSSAWHPSLSLPHQSRATRR